MADSERAATPAPPRDLKLHWPALLGWLGLAALVIFATVSSSGLNPVEVERAADGTVTAVTWTALHGPLRMLDAMLWMAVPYFMVLAVAVLLRAAFSRPARRPRALMLNVSPVLVCLVLMIVTTWLA